MLHKEDHTSQFMRGLPFFKGLAEEELDSFWNAALIKDYPKNTSLFFQGSAANRLFIVLSGWVKLFRNTVEGDEVIVALFTRGDVFGEAAIFADAGYPFSATAAEDVHVIEISAALTRERASSSPVIMTHIMNAMSRAMRKLQIENEHMTIMNAAQRVGCLLLQLSSGMAGRGGTFTFPYDKSLAAARLGMKAETFSRALIQLHTFGVLSSGTDIFIDDFHKLSTYCCGHCSAELKDCEGAARRLCSGKECSGGVCGLRERGLGIDKNQDAFRQSIV